MAGRFAGGVTPLLVLALISESGQGTEKTVAWRHTFWIFGSIGVLWCSVFWWWFRDRPEQKASVNRAELELIRHEEGPAEAAHFNVPWRRLLTNRNLWVLCGMYFCAAYGWYFNITYLPGYLKESYGISAGAKWSSQFWTFSLMAGAPLLLGSLACLVGGVLSDRFIRRTGNRKWGRRLFGVVGHGLCALCYFASIFADNPWVFVLAIALAAFWNDMTMGAAWASCLDIGKRYSGIVAGCMNTIGNLGGAVAGFLTGWILDLHTAAARAEAAGPVAALVGGLAAPGGAPSLAGLVPVADIPGHVAAAARPGWVVNFLIFAGVYVVAALLWLRFDSTRPVVTE
jgi:nitrate/nitrite transporter NarK